MMDTKEQIRTALIEIAEALGRPHYEPLTVREVLASFDRLCCTNLSVKAFSAI